MDRTTLERALHLWPDWSASIESSRERLGYHTSWPVADRIQWTQDNYPLIRNQATQELERLDLPTNLFQYWEDCLYTDYRHPNGDINYDSIRRRIGDFNDRGEFVRGNKSLPPLPWEQSIVWYGQEDIHHPWLRVEIRLHSRFFTKELLADATSHAYRTVQHQVWSEGVELHPVMKNVGRAKVSNPLWAARAREAWEATQDIDETLHRLYWHEEVRNELHAVLAEHDSQFERKRAEQDFRNKFRDRLMRTLRRLDDSPPRPRQRWWLPRE